VPGLEVRELNKAFAGDSIIDDVSFEIADGELFVLLGPSGGGKTTIMRLVCGLEAPDSGAIVIAGRDVTRLPPRERNVGMVFQEYGLYPNMDVFHNVAYGLEARGMARAEVQERVTQAAEILGLTSMLRQSVVDLSGGEQQRVALARALAKDADVYLYDEPLSNLDPKLRHHARRQILDIHRRKRKPSLYVTHDQTEALAMADRIGVMAKGRLQQVGTPEQLLDEPENVFVARFIGSPPMNLIPGRLAMNGDRYLVETEGVRLPLARDWQPLLDRYGKRDVLLGIRPERMSLAVDGESAITAIVEDVEALIGETSVMFRLPGGASLVGLFAQDMDSLAPGHAAAIAIEDDGVALFDPETESSLRVQ
jgi:multiple sugar transport system ATP-binding protein